MTVTDASPTHIIARELHAWSALAKHQAALSRQRRPHHMMGHRISTHRGRGLEFAEVRAYQPGDDIRSIDWRVTARKGKTHTRLYHEEREQPVSIVCDLRSSMAFGSQVRFKSVLAAHIAALCGWLACYSGNRVGFVLLTNQGIHSQKPMMRERAVDFLIQSLERADPTRMTNDNDTVAGMDELVRQLSLSTRPGYRILLISDFPDWQALAPLSGLKANRDIAVLHCHDQLDEQLPPAGEYVITNGRQKAVIHSGNRQQRQRYQQLYAERIAHLKTISGYQHYFSFPTHISRENLLQYVGEIMA
ncbi:DUF58 domain-containing protein [Gynuella sunshinyii]|uniref:Putative conserved protein (Some members containing a von Willebrand factor type A (VWA) domain) n=1 Tax=Gynuella sunshinyii YC6258 TaxID=1445510 RepID=A0A0C5VPS1_9GAMM|nr:DUF58 domain-containing protein [Gynuella sunshinyii]AJQ95428.1 putative conserved protein (some members containing a von Willebrand factor type A (vWA) domain) [Gynuella sunshinyii YC6258]